MEHFEIGYLMGLIVGEGSFTGSGPQPWLAVRLHAEDPVPLERLRVGLGGRVYGPYLHRGRRSRVWMLQGRELLDALPLLYDRLPESKKRMQFEEWLKKHGLKSIARRSAFWRYLSAAARELEGLHVEPSRFTVPTAVETPVTDRTLA